MKYYNRCSDHAHDKKKQPLPLGGQIQWRRKRINKISGSEVDQPDQKFVDVNRAEKGKIIYVVRK